MYVRPNQKHPHKEVTFSDSEEEGENNVKGWRFQLRMQRISEHQTKIEALGLSKLVTIFKDRIQKAKKKDKKKANDDDENYVPDYEGGLGSKSSSENYMDDKPD